MKANTSRIRNLGLALRMATIFSDITGANPRIQTQGNVVKRTPVCDSLPYSANHVFLKTLCQLDKRAFKRGVASSAYNLRPLAGASSPYHSLLAVATVESNWSGFLGFPQFRNQTPPVRSRQMISPQRGPQNGAVSRTRTDVCDLVDRRTSRCTITAWHRLKESNLYL